MEVIRTAAACHLLAGTWREQEATVGLVPTMGALHAGHDSLLRRARAERDRVLATIFVNPTQFGAGEDFDRYPRDEAADLARCEREHIDAVWVPSVDQVYPPGVDLPQPDPGPVGDTFEGLARPGHFRGVLQVVRRMFDLVGPCHAYFGQKDAQQLFLIRQMVNQAEQLPGIDVIACPTVRERDGLAVSSRNAMLTAEEREQAGCLFLALSEAAEAAHDGERKTAVLIALMAREIGATPLARLDHAAVIDEATFEPIAELDRPARAIVAAAFPSARLIDNVALPVPAP